MRQVSQLIHGGGPRVEIVPAPAVRPGGVLVRTAYSLVSAGTDRLILGMAGQSLLGKARSRPDQVRGVLKKLRSDGLRATWDAVRARLGDSIPLGYSASGVVVETGAGVTDLHVGQRVACAGMGHASHAELIFVPQNLVVPVPRGLSLKAAATVTLGAIALQGVRRADVRLGERVGVIGLGLIGLLTVQLLRASGCHVFAMDLDREKAGLAGAMGAEVSVTPEDGDLEERARQFGKGHGLDAVIVTAGSGSSEPTILAARMCRLAGRVVVVGAVGLDLPRGLLYDKELDLRLARSYGPGRYDPSYEEKGRDYPYAYVRFTEARNMEEYLALLGRDVVEVDELLTHEYGIEEGEEAYRFLMSEEGRSVVGLLFSYPEEDESAGRARVSGRRVRLGGSRRRRSGVGVALLGAGSFARSVLLPVLGRMPDFRATGVVTTRGLSALTAGRAGGFAYATTRLRDVLEDEETQAVVVATRHGEHARIAKAAMRAGKDVFLEKPLALSREELEGISRVVAETRRMLMVGFNRRFAPTFTTLRRSFSECPGPLQMLYRVDAGSLPTGHWTLDPEEGGGRILGEACHFVDLMCRLAAGPPVLAFGEGLSGDGLSGTLRFADGSVGTLVYAVGGDPAGGKERLEVLGGGSTGVIENFRRVTVATHGRVRRARARRGKGHREEMRAFLDAVRRGGPSPVPFGEARSSTLATLALVESSSCGRPVAAGGDAG